MNRLPKDGPIDRALITSLSIEAAQIARALELLAESNNKSSSRIVVDARFVRRMINLRQERSRHFPQEFLSDPAWDMLLDLVVARLEGRKVSASSLCIAAAVPTTTALRWIKSMTDAGIFERGHDPSDARRTWIWLSDSSHEGMMTWLSRAAETFTMD